MLPKEKLERVRYLLDNWDAIFDGAPSSEPFGLIIRSAPGPSSPGKLPEMAEHGSVKELERCLRLLAGACPGDYRHLRAFRCGAEWRGSYRWVRIKLPSGRHDIVQQRTTERIVPCWINPIRVLNGEKFLCHVFRGSVSIPDELYPRFLSLQAEAGAA